MGRYIFLLILIFSNAMAQEAFDYPITDIQSTDASGELSIQIRDWDHNIKCYSMPIAAGNYDLCVEETLPNYDFFIVRDTASGDWYKRITRLYDYFPEINIHAGNKEEVWLKQQSKKNHALRVELKSERMDGSGYEFKHSESRRNFAFFKIANDSLPIMEDTTQYQYNYDWEEEINGRYQSYYTNGKKYCRHKYKIIRYMYYNKKRKGKNQTFAVDIVATGKIEMYHFNGRKKKVVEYKDVMIREQTLKEKDGIKKYKRKADVVEYYDNRKKKAKGEYVDGLRSGKWELFHDNGKIYQKVVYEKGIKNGAYKEFSHRGKLLEKGDYVNGVKKK